MIKSVNKFLFGSLFVILSLTAAAKASVVSSILPLSQLVQPTSPMNFESTGIKFHWTQTPTQPSSFLRVSAYSTTDCSGSSVISGVVPASPPPPAPFQWQKTDYTITPRSGCLISLSIGGTCTGTANMKIEVLDADQNTQSTSECIQNVVCNLPFCTTTSPSALMSPNF